MQLTWYRGSTAVASGRTYRPTQADLGRYDELRTLIADTIRSRTRAEWTEVFDGTDACVAPILRMSEAPEHPHFKAREIFVERDGVVVLGGLAIGAVGVLLNAGFVYAIISGLMSLFAL